MAIDFHTVWIAYNKALRTQDDADWILYIRLSDLYNAQWAADTRNSRKA